MTECIECGYKLKLKDVEEGEILVCPECGTELEIVSTDPIKIDYAPEEEEDWGE